MATRSRSPRLTWGSVFIALIIVIIKYYESGHIPTSLATPNPQITVTPGPDQQAVTRVVDGDTIVVRQSDGTNATVRLIGVDTPETVKPNTPVQCGGKPASDYTKSTLSGQFVRLSADPENSNTDKYGRLLRYVYLPDGSLFNENLVTNGYGFAYTVYKFTKLDSFKQAEQAAKTANLGLWATCNVDSSKTIEQTTSSKLQK